MEGETAHISEDRAAAPSARPTIGSGPPSFAASSVLPPMAPPRVLVVDDDAALRAVLQEALEDAGMQVQAVDSGHACLEVFPKIHPDVVLLDAHMPDLDGFATCAQLQQLPGGASTPVLMVINLRDDASVERAFAAGVADVMPKPFQLTVLEHRIRRLAETRWARAILQASEERFTAIFSASPIAAAILSLADCRILEVNDSFLELLGYTRAEVIGSTSLVLGLWVDPEEHARMVAILEQQRRVRNMELRMRAKDGTVWHLLYSMEAISLAGEPCALAYAQDITGRKAAEDAMRTSEARFRSLFANAREAIYITNLDGKILDANQAALDLFGTTRVELLHLHATNF
jgi:PAS domain S-box-containing protein